MKGYQCLHAFMMRWCPLLSRRRRVSALVLAHLQVYTRVSEENILCMFFSKVAHSSVNEISFFTIMIVKI
jgi:hypothetical protein